MGKPMLATAACAAVAITLGIINIWIGILSLPILYEIAQSYSED
jgi:hypothetical protein